MGTSVLVQQKNWFTISKTYGTSVTLKAVLMFKSLKSAVINFKVELVFKDRCP